MYVCVFVCVYRWLLEESKWLGIVFHLVFHTCLLTVVFRPYTFNAFINVVMFKSVILLCLYLSFSFFLFFAFI